MSPLRARVARARLLLDQSRPADALREAQEALAFDPHDHGALGVRVLALHRLDRHAEALAAADAFLGLAPDEADAWYVRSSILNALERHAEAMESVNHALRLDPRDPDYFALRAALRLNQLDYRAALADAEAGLALNPAHAHLTSVRAILLERLDRLDDSAVAAESAVRLAPENALAHAVHGWSFLQRGDVGRAQESFREALRLDPHQDRARTGLLEAMKARNPVYRLLLGWFLWLGRQSEETRSAFRLRGRTLLVLLGGVVLWLATPHDNAWYWILGALVSAWCGYAYLSIAATPMFNLFLRADRFGRHLLTAEDRRSSTMFAIGFVPLLAALVWWPLGGGGRAVVLAVVCAIGSIVLAVSALLRREAAPAESS